MVEGAIPVRRVVTGNDERGRSRVLYDSAAPNVKAWGSPGRCMTDVWVFDECPADISGDCGDGNRDFNFEPPARGAMLRITQAPAKPAAYDPAKDPTALPFHEPKKTPGGTWERGGWNIHRARTHKTETIDYAFCLEGGRILYLDDGEYRLNPGDVVVQLGSWHAWGAVEVPARMVYVMIGARFEE